MGNVNLRIDTSQNGFSKSTLMKWAPSLCDGCACNRSRTVGVKHWCFVRRVGELVGVRGFAVIGPLNLPWVLVYELQLSSRL